MTPGAPQTRYRRPWGSYRWDALGSGHEWLSLVRCPVPYVIVREAGSRHPFKVFVGRPQKIDPGRRYEWATFQLQVGQDFLDVIGRGGAAIGAESNATLTWLPGIDGVQNPVDLIGGPVPVPYGRVISSFVTQNAAATNEGFALALSCEQAKAIVVSLSAVPNTTGEQIELTTEIDTEAGTVGALASTFTPAAAGIVRHVYTGWSDDAAGPKHARALPGEMLRLSFDFTGTHVATVNVGVEMALGS